MKKWTKEEENELIKIYSDEKNEIIAKLLNKEISQIERKANRLKLKKSKTHLSKNAINRNKLIGRDLSFEKLKDIASKYKTRGEFQRMDGSAYTTARIAGYLDEICSHMITNNHSIPQLVLLSIIKKLFSNDIVTYNNKKIISPYEIDVYLEKYKIGFEYDGKLWHNDNKIDLIKDKLCKHKNITLIRLKENNRKYEIDIKSQLIENLFIINNVCNKNFNKRDIENIPSDYINNFINDNIIDENEIIKIINKYDNYHDFITNEIKLYQKLIKLGILNKYTSNLKRDNVFWNKELAIAEIKKYDNISDFIKKSNACYQYIKKNNLSELLNDLKYKYSYLNISDVKKEIDKYKYLKDFREKSPKHYYFIKRFKLYNLTKDLKRLK